MLMCSILLSTLCEQIRYRSGFGANTRAQSHVGLHSHLRNHSKLRGKAGHRSGSKARSVSFMRDSKIAPMEQSQATKLNNMGQYAFKS